MENNDNDWGDGPGEVASAEVFQSYTCASLKEGRPHPGDIAEPASLAAISLPHNDYPLDAFPSDIISNGKLSSLQLEGMRYACERHRHWLPSGERQGFFLGDGAGVGKGRQISAIILDNHVRGRPKHVWISSSTDLYQDAVRDLRDLGAHLPVIQNIQAIKVRRFPRAKQRSRPFLYLSLMCLPVMISSARAKNFVPGKEAQSTRVALCVLQIQEQLPAARVVYCSATGVSEVGNLAYMSRLGLWGLGSPFPDFDSFLASMRRRGVTFMEMLAMELKGQGLYVSRGLSFREAEFAELACPLSNAQRAQYDAAASLWRETRETLARCMANSRRDPWKPFHGAVQRFFKLLLVSFKVPNVVQEAQRALAAGECVVIGLQSTGEAAMEALGLDPGALCAEFVSTCREIAIQFLTNHFPCREEEQQEESSDIQSIVETVHDNDQDQSEQNVFELEDREPTALEERDRLIEAWRSIDLPPNFLDVLVDELGGPACVAEMTGRKARICRDTSGDKVGALRYTPRVMSESSATELDSLNVREKAAFMAEKKLVAIISDAASTGISLHASAAVINRRRRLHLTIELPWSADKAIQQLGRSHRANQVSAPRYLLVHTDAGGEARFAAAVARRLQSLGALTRGDRRAASGLDLSAHDVDCPAGRKALRRMLEAAQRGAPLPPPGVKLHDVLRRVRDPARLAALLSGNEGLAIRTAAGLEGMSAADLVDTMRALHASLRNAFADMGVSLSSTDSTSSLDVRRFLNRILCLEIDRQNALFDYFQATLAAEIRAQRAEGTWSEGVCHLPGRGARRERPATLLWVDPPTALRTLRHDLLVDRGLSYDAALSRLAAATRDERALSSQGESSPSSFMVSRRPMYGRPAYILALQRLKQPGTFAVVRPGTGVSAFDSDADELGTKYLPCSAETAKEGWAAAYDAALTGCIHGRTCRQGADCMTGRRRLPVTLLTGSVIRIWDVLERVLAAHEHDLPKSERALRIVRVELRDEGENAPIIGVRYPAALLPEVVATLVIQVQLSGSCQGATPRRTDPISPIIPRYKARVYSAPKTVLDFFKPQKKARLANDTDKLNTDWSNELKNEQALLGSKIGSKESASQVISLLTDGEDSLPALPARQVPPAVPAPREDKPEDASRLTVKRAELTAMGFTEQKADLALKVCRGDVERAANWLLMTSNG